MKHFLITFLTVITLSGMLTACDEGSTTVTPSNGSGGNGGGGNNSVSCEYTTYTGVSCKTDYVQVSSTVCCPAKTPYYCASTNTCYATCEEAPCSGSILKGGSSGSGGGGGNTRTCNWQSAVNYVSVTTKTGKLCGEPTSLEIIIKNNSNAKLKIYSCIQRSDGSWDGLSDGLFADGVPSGGTTSHYVCTSTGHYKIYAMTLADYGNYNTSDHCPFPGCN